MTSSFLPGFILMTLPLQNMPFLEKNYYYLGKSMGLERNKAITHTFKLDDRRPASMDSTAKPTWSCCWNGWGGGKCSNSFALRLAPVRNSFTLPCPRTPRRPRPRNPRQPPRLQTPPGRRPTRPNDPLWGARDAHNSSSSSVHSIFALFHRSRLVPPPSPIKKSKPLETVDF